MYLTCLSGIRTSKRKIDALFVWYSRMVVETEVFLTFREQAKALTERCVHSFSGYRSDCRRSFPNPKTALETS